MGWIVILAFAFSSSIDNLGVGISYGIREIRIGKKANFVMSFICFLMSLMGISFGIWLSNILPGVFPLVIGTVFLLIIGIRIILLGIPRKQEPESPTTDNGKAADLKGILSNPELADVDGSGEIGFWEAAFLGIALSANALTNGLGAGLLGFSPLAISLTAAVGSFFSVWAGVRLGFRLSVVRIGSFSLGQLGTIISGVLLLAIAFFAFF